MNVLRLSVACVGVATAVTAIAPVARGEDFPARPVKIIVQTAAGSSLDVMARLVTEQLAQIWGQQPIVVNEAGAGGLLAARTTAASAPDGYTLFMAGGSVFVVLPEVQRNLAFDVNDFVPIGFIAEQPYALLASNKLGVDSVAELIALSKQQPGGLDVPIARAPQRCLGFDRLVAAGYPNAFEDGGRIAAGADRDRLRVRDHD
jgi:tripartite-type tricarboxylate transporter receptor subunit TctC